MASSSKQEEQEKFRSHSEIFAIVAKMGKLNFRYVAKITYGCPLAKNKIVHSN